MNKLKNLLCIAIWLFPIGPLVCLIMMLDTFSEWFVEYVMGVAELWRS